MTHHHAETATESEFGAGRGLQDWFLQEIYEDLLILNHARGPARRGGASPAAHPAVVFRSVRVGRSLAR